nr:MAG TPA: hypothetical protein [Caudoviricetes sp.]
MFIFSVDYLQVSLINLRCLYPHTISSNRLFIIVTGVRVNGYSHPAS